MKLSLAILYRDLQPLHETCGSMLETGSTLTLRYASPLIDSAEIDSSVLYVVEKDELDAIVIDEALKPSFLCLGQPSQAFLAKQDCNIVWIMSKTLTKDMLFAWACKQFSYYHDIHLAMEEVLSKGKPPSSLVTLFASLLDRDFFVWDLINSEVLFSSFKHLSSDNASELIEHYESEMGVHQGTQTCTGNCSEILVGCKSQAKLELLSYRIIIDEREAAILVVVGEGEPFDGRDRALATFISQVLQKSIKRNPAINFSAPTALVKMFEQMIENNTAQTYYLEKCLVEVGWGATDKYLCIVIQLSDQYYASESLVAISSKMSIRLPGIIHVKAEQELVLIANLSRLDSEADEIVQNIVNEYAPYLPHVRIGVSHPFNEMENLYYYRRQASKAVELGKRQTIEESAYRFEDYQLDYIVDCCLNDMTATALFPPGMSDLVVHEYEHDPELGLVNFLELYIKNDFQPEKTAKAGFISRNTVFNKLKKIKQISGLDLNDFNTKMNLKIAYHAMNWLKDVGTQIK